MNKPDSGNDHLDPQQPHAEDHNNMVAETGEFAAQDPYANYDPLQDDFGSELNDSSEEKPRMGLIVALAVALLGLVGFLAYRLFAPEPSVQPVAAPAEVAAEQQAADPNQLEKLSTSIEEALPATDALANEELEALADEQTRVAEQSQELEAQIADAEALSALKAQQIEELKAQIAALQSTESEAPKAPAADQSGS